MVGVCGVYEGFHMADVSNELGLVHVITGDGKGKTTSSLGLALRALGHGFKVCFIQFMKGGYYFGELVALEKFKDQIETHQFGQSTTHADKIRSGELKPSKAIFLPFEDEGGLYRKGFEFAKKKIKSGKFNLVILDEINVVLSMKFLDIKDVLELILSKPSHVELVLTGRNAPKELYDVADYVNEVVSHKHPYDTRKIVGRRGIEY